MQNFVQTGLERTSGVTPTGATGALAPVIFGILFSKIQI